MTCCEQLFNTYRSFASDPEKEGISRSLQETEEWLYEDGDDETENTYTSKMQDLRKVISPNLKVQHSIIGSLCLTFSSPGNIQLVDPIENRYKDAEARAQAKRDLLNSIVDYRKSVDSRPTEDRELVR